jgi:hypothetical protein
MVCPKYLEVFPGNGQKLTVIVAFFRWLEKTPLASVLLVKNPKDFLSTLLKPSQCILETAKP